MSGSHVAMTQNTIMSTNRAIITAVAFYMNHVNMHGSAQRILSGLEVLGRLRATSSLPRVLMWFCHREPCFTPCALCGLYPIRSIILLFKP